MLRRRNEGDRLPDEQFINSFADQLDRLDLWIRTRPNFSVLYLNYDDIVQDPEHAASEIKNFL